MLENIWVFSDDVNDYSVLCEITDIPKKLILVLSETEHVYFINLSEFSPFLAAVR